MVSERLYIVHHRGSRFRGRTVRVLLRPNKPMMNCKAQDVETGEVFICPFRGLWRAENGTSPPAAPRGRAKAKWVDGA